jgi:hypothetical protein
MNRGRLPATRWRLTRVPTFPDLNVALTVDTTAPAVVRAIEQAAADAGIALERTDPDDLLRRRRIPRRRPGGSPNGNLRGMANLAAIMLLCPGRRFLRAATT